jgi:uncharacterized protein
MTQGATRLFRPQDYRSMPWKNGGGSTTELVIEPAGATLDSGFHWRLSMADVGVSGPFSCFAGCERTLLLLEGGGLRLEFDQGEAVQLEHILEPVRFSGDLRTSGTLLAGTCRDFNVITQRAQCRHRLEVLALDAHPRLLAPAAVRFIFCAAGRLQVGSHLLSPLELLRVEGAMTHLEACGQDSGTAILVGIDPIA